MSRILLLALLLAGLNVALYAQDSSCSKCCGVLDPGTWAHRSCDYFGSGSGRCHVTQCQVSMGNEGNCCFSGADKHNDVCSDIEAPDDSIYHPCHEV